MLIADKFGRRAEMEVITQAIFAAKAMAKPIDRACLGKCDLYLDGPALPHPALNKSINFV